MAGLRLPFLGWFWRAALSLRRLNVENVVKRSDHFVTPFLNFFLRIWPMLGHTSTPTANPS